MPVASYICSSSAAYQCQASESNDIHSREEQESLWSGNTPTSSSVRMLVREANYSN